MSTHAPFAMTAPPDVYRQRRARLAESLNRPLIVFSGHAPARNYPNNAHVFRAGSTYLYFGGPPIENAALAVEPESDGQLGCTLVRPLCGPEDVLWGGGLPPDEILAHAAGLRPEALVAPDQLEWLLAGHEAAAIIPPYPNTIAWAARLGLEAAATDEMRAIVDLRLTKDEHELAAMRRAARITMDAHRAALAAARPTRREADVAAAFGAVLAANGAQPAFTPIITVRGEVLHALGHANALTSGSLLLIDAGAEEPGGYASDITRTVPVSGQWTPVQRHLYETTRRALDAATAACVPGRRYRDVHDLAARVICEGLIQAELLRGEPDDLVQRNAHALFFPHGVGHLIGLDAHDLEDFGDLAGYAAGRTRRPEFGGKYLRLDRDLGAGMAVTIEPGIYLVPAIWEYAALVRPLADVVNRPKVEALLRDRFGGIRIEHTICVRGADGPEVLSRDLPTEPDAIAALVGTAAETGTD